MKIKKVRSAIRRYERFAFYWYMSTGQILEYYQCKQQYIAFLRFHKNLKRHLQPNSIYMKQYGNICKEKKP